MTSMAFLEDRLPFGTYMVTISAGGFHVMFMIMCTSCVMLHPMTCFRVLFLGRWTGEFLTFQILCEVG